MAKKKSHKKKSHRRHKVGALSLNASSPLVMLGSVAVGYLGGSAINSAINMLIPASMKTQPYTGKAAAGVQVGLGALLILGKGKKSMLKTVAGGLLAGSGIKRATIVFAPNTTDTLGGYGSVPVLGAYSVPGQIGYGKKVAGYGNVPVIGAYTPASALNGSKVMGSTNSASSYNNGGSSSYMG